MKKILTTLTISAVLTGCSMRIIDYIEPKKPLTPAETKSFALLYGPKIDLILKEYPFLKAGTPKEEVQKQLKGDYRPFKSLVTNADEYFVAAKNLYLFGGPFILGFDKKDQLLYIRDPYNKKTEKFEEVGELIDKSNVIWLNK